MKPIPLMLLGAVLAAAQIPVIAPNGQQVLSGRITSQPPQPQQPTSYDCAVDGSVVNSITGEPMPRTRVSLMSPASGGASSTSSADSSGKWSLSGVACGTAQVFVARPGFLMQARRSLNLVSGSPVHDVKIELIPQ